MLFELILLLSPGCYSLLDTDWRESMTPIRDMGSCGGAVTPSAILSALEWHIANITGHLAPLSAQYLIDCGVDGRGYVVNRCDGEPPNEIFRQIMTEQYLPYETDYEYLANFEPGRCEEVGGRGLRNGLADVWFSGYVPLGTTPQDTRVALQTSPTINAIYTGRVFEEEAPPGLTLTDNTCNQQLISDLVTFAGWKENGGDPYFIVRGNSGEKIGVDGYLMYADNSENARCMYAKRAYRLEVSRRREVEYQVGKGKLSFYQARNWCKNLGPGWDLAHIPTEKHNYEVYDMFTAEYGSRQSRDESFNFFWVGLLNTESKHSDAENWVWVGEEEETSVKFHGFERRRKFRFGVMQRFNRGPDFKRGSWTTRPGKNLYRFVCSRYRTEECPRISHTAIENAYSVAFVHGGEDTMDITAGTSVKVVCLRGNEEEGGVCVGGEWRDLPVCS